MASSKVIPSGSQSNPEVPRQPSLCSSLSTLLADLQNQQSQQQNPSQAMDDFLRNMYSSPPPPPDTHAAFHGASVPRDGGNKSVEDVWKEIVAGGVGDQRQGAAAERMTLEDFLTKAGAVREDDVRGVVNESAGVYAVDSVVTPGINGAGQYTPAFGNSGVVDQPTALVAAVGPSGGRGKRRAVVEPPVDKATLQKQRRMIKNRESAARSRERKQAYTNELETLLTQLEEENANLRREEAEQKKRRFKQLMENLIPVGEKPRPPRVLRRVQSMQW